MKTKTLSLTLPLLYDPGEHWEYGINIDWAGKMVEAVSGQKLGAYMKANLFDPLGMSSTAFRITPDMRSRLAGTHLRGAGTYDEVEGEKCRVNVTLCTGIDEERVRKANLGYLAPDDFDLAAYEADPDTMVVPNAGETLFRLR